LRRLITEILKVEIDLSGSYLLEEWVLRHEIRLGGEPVKETIKVGNVILDGYPGEGLVLRLTRFKKKTTEVS